METRELPAAVDEFIEAMGMIAQADGLPRIAGRIMGFLVIFGGPVSFGDLADRLAISRASVSTNARLLEQIGIVERVGRAGDRQDYFRLSQAPYRRLMQGYAARMARAQRTVEDACHGLPDEWSGARSRLAELGAFYATVAENARRLADDMPDDLG